MGKGGGYFNNKNSGNGIVDWISGGGYRNYTTKSRYITIGSCTGWDYIIVIGETYV